MIISAETVISALFLIAPQFYTTDPDILASYNELYTLVSCQINPQILSCCGVMVFAFLMAHYLTLSTTPTLGMQSNIHEGDLSIGYNVAYNMSALEMTPYGRSYLDLVKRTVVGSTVTNLPVIFGGVIQNMPLGMGCCNGGGWGYGSAGGGCGC